MIRYIDRKDIDDSKYNACIQNAINSRIYAFSWYLDIVADNWDVLVLDDYKVVMPLPWRKKFFVKYVYPPFWLLELGIFYATETINEEAFLKEACNRFKFIELRMNTANLYKSVAKNGLLKQFQFLPLKQDYDLVKKDFRKDRLKDLRKATEHGLIEKWNDTPEKLVKLFKENVGKRTLNIKEKDYQNLLKLIKVCLNKGIGDILAIYDAKNQLTASAFLLKHGATVTILVSSTDFNNRKNGANTFLIDRAIQKYHKDFEVFNFGGSSMQTIANYFKSFGALQEEYHLIKYNNLPKLLRVFKQ